MTTRKETKTTYTFTHEDIKALVCEKYKLDPSKVVISWYASESDYTYDASLEFKLEIKECS